MNSFTRTKAPVHRDSTSESRSFHQAFCSCQVGRGVEPDEHSHWTVIISSRSFHSFAHRTQLCARRVRRRETGESYVCFTGGFKISSTHFGSVSDWGFICHWWVASWHHQAYPHKSSFANWELPLSTTRHITRKLALPKWKPKCFMQQTPSILNFCNVRVPNASPQ